MEPIWKARARELREMAETFEEYDQPHEAQTCRDAADELERLGKAMDRVNKAVAHA